MPYITYVSLDGNDKNLKVCVCASIYFRCNTILSDIICIFEIQKVSMVGKKGGGGNK